MDHKMLFPILTYLTYLLNNQYLSMEIIVGDYLKTNLYGNMKFIVNQCIIIIIIIHMIHVYSNIEYAYYTYIA